MKLIIAEKPAVSRAIASVLGVKKREDGYMEGNGYLVSWCFGHLAELADADAYDEKYAKWRYEDLPVMPNPWQYTVSRDKKKQLDLLCSLMKRNDVTEVVNACDAGREGELIFRTVYKLSGCMKPMKRLWISSMEDAAILDGFTNLRDGAEYDRLYESALCRSKADWLVGINATRLFSVLYHRTLNVGRVISPTLALLVQREAEIGAFKSEPFYTVNLDFGDFNAAGEKLADAKDANTNADACRGNTARIVAVDHKEKSEKAPALYDLTTLQRDANRILGYTAQQTLDYLQSLYEDIFYKG
jgi:DNA topoisomerase-3